jgi:hypothetical protein
MQSAHTGADAQVVLRPTQLVAEALVHGHNFEELVSRARSVGLSRDLTETVVTVCCRDRRSSEPGAPCASGRRD